MPNITLKSATYHLAEETVALLMIDKRGRFFLNTTEAALTARTPHGTGVWGNTEALSEAQELMNKLYEGDGYIVVLDPKPAPLTGRRVAGTNITPVPTKV